MNLQRQTSSETVAQVLTGSEGVTVTSTLRPLSAMERRAAEREEEEALIAGELEVFNAITDAEKRKVILKWAETKWTNEIAWARSLDSKISPILAVSGFSIGGLITLLTQAHLFESAPAARVVLSLALPFLLYAVIKAVLVISPTLRVSEPVYRILGLLHIFSPRHVAHDDTHEWRGHLYFGHTAKYTTAGQFMHQAIPHFQDEAIVLRDLMTQSYNNSRISQEKCVEIAMAVRGILIALLIVLFAGVLFALKH